MKFIKQGEAYGKVMEKSDTEMTRTWEVKGYRSLHMLPSMGSTCLGASSTLMAQSQGDRKQSLDPHKVGVEIKDFIKPGKEHSQQTKQKDLIQQRVPGNS